MNEVRSCLALCSCVLSLIFYLRFVCEQAPDLPVRFLVRGVQSRISVHFFVLLVLLASSAFAGELSSEQQIDALRAELTASRARNEQLNGKIEQLNAMLKSQNGQQKAEKVLLEASGKVGKLDNADTASAHDPFSNETCSDHCNGTRVYAPYA